MLATPATVATGGFIAVIAAGWDTVKNYILQLKLLFIAEYTARENVLMIIVRRLVENGWRPIPTSSKHLFISSRSVAGSAVDVPIVHVSAAGSRKGSTIMRRGKTFITIGNNSITALRIFNLEKIIAELEINIETKNENQRFCIIRRGGSRFRNNQGNGNPDSIVKELSEDIIENVNFSLPLYKNKQYLLTADSKHKMIDCLYITESMKTIRNEGHRWMDNRAWFEERYMPWKRGWLFYGRPGCGKTRFAIALAEELDMPVYSFDLASMTNDDFYSLYSNINSRDGSMVLLEDIDSVFNKRVNITNTQNSIGLTFDSLLNTIDGATSVNGIILVITTNNLEALDDALIRPGRVDQVLEFNGINLEGRQFIADKIFKGLPRDKWEHIIHEYDDHVSGAVYQNACYKLAMELFWSYK